jgi:hypothetical protein
MNALDRSMLLEESATSTVSGIDQHRIPGV